MQFDIETLKVNKSGLILAISQQNKTNKVLMLAWMNRRAIIETLQSGNVTYWSRSRQQLWRKGATSGHTQQLVSFHYDCDKDCLLLIVEQVGSACHTNRRSCFYHQVIAGSLCYSQPHH